MNQTDKNKPTPRSPLQEMNPYEPGKPMDEIAREYNLDRPPVKLASNENPHPPPEELRSVYQESFDSLNRYPDGGAYHLRSALSDYYDWPMEGIVVGAGSDEITDFLARGFLGPDDEVIVADPSFVRHSMLPTMMGAKPVPVPVTETFDFDLEAMLDAVNERTRWICFPNPNNPTSRYVTEEDVLSFLDELDSRLTVIYDEAYFEFMDQTDYPNGRDILERYSGDDGPEIILQRTFSKAYGLAGLRVGYGLMDPAIAQELHKVRPPFNVSRPAQAVARAALENDGFVERSRETIIDERQRLTEALEDRGIRYVEPSVNFLLIEAPGSLGAQDLSESLLKRGVILRSMVPYGLENHLRLSVGTNKENSRFLGALDEIIG